MQQSQEDLIKTYQRDGYILLKDFFSSDEIDEIKRELQLFIKRYATELKNDEINYTTDGEINSIHRLAGFDSPYQGFFKELLNKEKVINIVRLLLNDEAQPRKAEYFAKPAKTGLKSPLHQDNFYWGIEDHNGLTIWCCLEESNIQNGGISYVTGSHKKGLIQHVDSYAPGSSQMVPQEILDEFSDDLFITPDIKAGDILIHHSLMIHGSKENHSEKARPGITLQYKAKNSKYNKEMVDHYYNRLTKQVKLRQN